MIYEKLGWESNINMIISQDYTQLPRNSHIREKREQEDVNAMSKSPASPDNILGGVADHTNNSPAETYDLPLFQIRKKDL